MAIDIQERWNFNPTHDGYKVQIDGDNSDSMKTSIREMTGADLEEYLWDGHVKRRMPGTIDMAVHPTMGSGLQPKTSQQFDRRTTGRGKDNTLGNPKILSGDNTHIRNLRLILGFVGR